MTAPPRLLAAPDKYRGTATAAEAAAAMARAATACGWAADELSLADGGEGTLEVLAGLGERRVTTVAGPLGRPVVASWLLLGEEPSRRLGTPGPTALVEAAQAAGRALLPRPRGEDPLAASTAGVGQLVLAAVEAGAASVVVAVGGTATTDGGRGAHEAIGDTARLGDATLVVACDVSTPFADAAAVFGPQKGARPDQVRVLERRLADLADHYRAAHGTDVGALAGAGAGGGLAGGLAALGARLVSGFDMVARAVDLPSRLAAADAVATGEGLLDATSFEGKVVGGVLLAAAGRLPALCAPGAVATGTALPSRFGRKPHPVTVRALADAVGMTRARTATTSAIEAVVLEWLGRLGRRDACGEPH